MLDAFLQIRQEGFIPPQNWYNHLIPKLLNYADVEGTVLRQR